MAAIALVAAHGLGLQYIWSHTAMSMTVFSGLIVVILVKHAGLFGPLLAALRRFWRDRS